MHDRVYHGKGKEGKDCGGWGQCGGGVVVHFAWNGGGLATRQKFNIIQVYPTIELANLPDE